MQELEEKIEELSQDVAKIKTSSIQFLNFLRSAQTVGNGRARTQTEINGQLLSFLTQLSTLSPAVSEAISEQSSSNGSLDFEKHRGKLKPMQSTHSVKLEEPENEEEKDDENE